MWSAKFLNKWIKYFSESDYTASIKISNNLNQSLYSSLIYFRAEGYYFIMQARYNSLNFI